MDDRMPESSDLSQPGEEAAGDEREAAGQVEAELLRRGLQKVRRRRWFFWWVLIVYLPMMAVTQKITESFAASLPVFFAWCIVLLVATAVSATVRCPRCKNYFHVNGMTLLYLRKCLHCQLHVTADKRAAKHHG